MKHLPTLHDIGEVVIPREILGKKGALSATLIARLFSLAEVYDVLTHDRPYCAIMNKEEDLVEIAASGGSQFDPNLTKKI